jgi:HNH endonuclease
MFDPGVLHFVEGANIDRSYNAITLTLDFHRRFGNLQIYFEAIPGVEHTYTIKSTLPLLVFRPPLPITRALSMTPEHTIDPPMPRLLAIHRACCLILHISGAGEYIDKVLRDREAPTARSDGSTELGNLVSLGLYRLTSTAY